MSLVSLLSLSPVWIPPVLAGGWLPPLGLSMLLVCGWWWVFGEGSSAHRPKGASCYGEFLVRDIKVHNIAAP